MGVRVLNTTMYLSSAFPNLFSVSLCVAKIPNEWKYDIRVEEKALSKTSEDPEYFTNYKLLRYRPGI